MEEEEIDDGTAELIAWGFSPEAAERITAASNILTAGDDE